MIVKERIQLVLDNLGISAREFAARIHVQPTTISNMMSGRNNPSFDVLKKILEYYPSLNPDWLIHERGDMWRTPPGQEAGLFDSQPPEVGTVVRKTTVQPKEDKPQPVVLPSKQIKNIVVYFTDGTYEEYCSVINKSPRFPGEDDA